jgi:hypothetical protein
MPAIFARNAAAEKCTGRKTRPRWSDLWGTRRWKPLCLRWSGCAAYACGQVFTADAPPTAGPDKYDATAVAMIALMKYGTGVPFHRLERLEQQLGMPLPAATQWDLLVAAAQWIRAALEELIRQAAQGGVLHNDDTGMRILRLTREPGDKRTDTFTSGIVSMVGVWRIALYFTGWKHAGENMGDVLKQRARELPAPIQMCDALSRNTPKLEASKPCWRTASPIIWTLELSGVITRQARQPGWEWGGRNSHSR